MKLYDSLYMLAFVLLSFSNCSKNKDEAPKADNPYGLPNISQIGAGVLAWRENGQNRIAKYNNLLYPKAYVRTDSVAAFGGVTSSYFEFVTLEAYGNVKINTLYDLHDHTQTYFSYSTDSTCLGVSSTVTNVENTVGNVIFSRIDGVNNIVSGTFEFKVAIPSCDTIYVTDGRFDIQF